MQLGKTDKARRALEAGKAGEVDLRDRRILILADGKRTRAELIAMLGTESRAAIDRLVGNGFLAEPIVAAPMPTPQPPPVAPARAASPAPTSRRSLVAAKMYLVDMLQLQRTPTAAELRLAIQSTSDPVVLVERLLEALDHLVAATPPSYGERVHTRFSEVVPEDVLYRLAPLGARMRA
jgi:hypothetical protein